MNAALHGPIATADAQTLKPGRFAMERIVLREEIGPRAFGHVTEVADLLAACESCDICGAHPCRGGCWTGEFLGEERHRCEDEDACNAAFNHIAEVTR